MRRITGVLLAAGIARRFGGDKLLAPLANGAPLGLQTAQTLASVLQDCIAVVRVADDPFAQLLASAGWRCAVCPEAAEGMGASIRCAVAATSGVDAWVIALADMPFVQADSVRAVVAALNAGAALAAPYFEGRRGHPVGFSARFREALLTLRGDVGAREIVRAHEGELTCVEVADVGVLRDIDVPADLNAEPVRVAGPAEG